DVVAYHYALEADIAFGAQSLDGADGQRSRQPVAVAEARVIEVADHHRVEQAFFGELTVGLKLDLAPGVGDVGESLMAVGAARAVAWEVLGHGDDACVAVRQDKSAGNLAAAVWAA